MQMSSFYILREGQMSNFHIDEGANVHPCLSVWGPGFGNVLN